MLSTAPKDPSRDKVPAPDAADRVPVTVVVPIRNEEKNLVGCLSRLARFSEVVVVDSFSTDGSAQIAAAYGAKILQFSWDGRYPKKRNWVLINHALDNEWVLFLDADELVDDRFCDEVAMAVASGEHHGYWLNYTNYFLGRRLRHGVPQRKLALFRVGSGVYERIEEESWSSLDMEVHEHPIVEGSIGEINAPIEHNDFHGIEKLRQRHREYACWEARRFIALGELRPQTSLSFRQRQKYRYLDRKWFAAAYFFLTYVLKGGVLDGRAGFGYALLKWAYFREVRFKIEELRGRISGR